MTDGSPVEHHPALGRETRTGSWAEQATSTIGVIEDCVASGRLADAAALAGYTLTELSEGRVFFPLFVKSARAFLIAEGVTEQELASEEARLADLLARSDGSRADLEAAWAGYGDAVASFRQACEDGAERAREALATVLSSLELWRDCHDRACDLVYGMADVCARRLGEERVADLWNSMLADFFPTRDRYAGDVRPWEDSLDLLMLDTLETFRGHLSGPGRKGDLEVTEEEDCWAVSFEPCGSGGRGFIRGDDRKPLMEPPYGFAVTTQEHPWAWGKRGVCLYCVHCCLFQEVVPIEKLGYPLRVVDPPTWPASEGVGRCTWRIYKDPSRVPDGAYRRVGLERPLRSSEKENSKPR